MNDNDMMMMENLWRRMVKRFAELLLVEVGSSSGHNVM